MEIFFMVFYSFVIGLRNGESRRACSFAKGCVVMQIGLLNRVWFCWRLVHLIR